MSTEARHPGIWSCSQAPDSAPWRAPGGHGLPGNCVSNPNPFLPPGRHGKAADPCAPGYVTAFTWRPSGTPALGGRTLGHSAGKGQASPPQSFSPSHHRGLARGPPHRAVAEPPGSTWPIPRGLLPGRRSPVPGTKETAPRVPPHGLGRASPETRQVHPAHPPGGTRCPATRPQTPSAAGRRGAQGRADALEMQPAHKHAARPHTPASPPGARPPPTPPHTALTTTVMPSFSSGALS